MAHNRAALPGTAAIPRGPFAGAFRSAFSQQNALIAALVLVLGFMVLYPILAVIVNSLLPSRTFDGAGLDAWARAFSDPDVIDSIVNTLKVQIANQGISLPLAIVIAWVLARTDVPFGRWIEFGFWILFFLPALGVTTGWLLFFDPNYGLVNKWLIDLGIVDSAPFNMYSYWGIVFAHLTTYAVSVKVMLLTPAFRNLDGAIEEAARMCGASTMAAFFRIVIPILTPAIFVVFLMSLIRGLEAFEIELFLGVPINFFVYSTKIFQFVAHAPPAYAEGSALATAILVLMLPLIILQRWAATRRSYAVVSGRYTAGVNRLGRARWPVFAAIVLLVVFMSLVPLGLLVAGSFMKLFGFFGLPELWTLDHWRHAIADVTFTQAFRNMLVLGFGTSLCAVAVYVFVAYCTVRVKSVWKAPLDVLTWLPLTIPGIILGFGYLFMVIQVPVFEPLYGTIGVMILVSFLGAMTLGVQVIKVHMLQLGNEIEEAGRTAGASWFSTFCRVILPLTAPSLAVVGVLVFASTIRQIGSVILVSTGETRVLAVLQLDFLTDGRLGPAAVIGTIIVLISLIAALVIRVISVRFGVRTGGA
jgi:iron(III) transport system permease protein